MLVKHLHDFEYVEKMNGACLQKGYPFATIVAVEHNGEIKTGVAICSEYDVFNKKFGTEIAAGRALSGGKVKYPNRLTITQNYDVVQIAEVIKVELEQLKKRANRYFKQVHHV